MHSDVWSGDTYIHTYVDSQKLKSLSLVFVVLYQSFSLCVAGFTHRRHQNPPFYSRPAHLHLIRPVI